MHSIRPALAVPVLGLTLILAAAALPGPRPAPVPAPRLSAEVQDDQVIVRIDGAAFTAYRFGSGQKMPYFYPVAGPLSGLSLTTESSLPYPHHRSLWFGCDRVNGGNYWQEGNDRGQIVSRGPRVLAGGPDEVRIADVCDWRQPGRGPVIRDRREITVSVDPDGSRIIDFAVTLTALTDVRIEKTNHSLFAARVVPALSVEKGGVLINAEGLAGEKATAGTPSAWMDYSGTRFGLTEGLAIFDAPGNPWFPARWFTRDYGFFSPTNLNWIEDAGFLLPRGRSLPLRYRVVVHAGDAVAAGIAARYKDWKTEPVRLLTVDPGHFHAALVQKTRPFGVSPRVGVYAPAGPELDDHLARIRAYNGRADDPTDWEEVVHTGPGFFEEMLRTEKPGAVVVLAGNNRRKTALIAAALEAGFNVLADKPMAIDAAGYALLEKAQAVADQKNLVLDDIMTERYEVSNALQRGLVSRADLFGTLVPGTPAEPAVVLRSRHHFLKKVSGSPLIRPAWFFDPAQQGEGLTDVSTHLVDLVQWIGFPGRVIRPAADLRLLSARRGMVDLTRADFKAVTGLDAFPGYLSAYVRDGRLVLPADGTILYTIDGRHVRLEIEWRVEPPPGGGDSHEAIFRGTRAAVIIRPVSDADSRPDVHVQPAAGVDKASLRAALDRAVAGLQADFPGIAAEDEAAGWRIRVPEALRLGHEAHFAEVLRRYLARLGGRGPDTEAANRMAKYWLTTTALTRAR